MRKSKGKKQDQLVLVTGNDEDGWNVEAEIDQHRIVCACESKSDADDLCDSLNRCVWFEVK